jgi:DNA primase
MTGSIQFSSFKLDLLARIDIVEIIEDCLALRKSGRNYIAPCPFHQEKTPSFVVSPEKQIYHCFGCNAGGNAISFLMNYKHLDFMEALEILAQKAGLTIPTQKITGKPQQYTNKQQMYKLLERAAKLYQETLYHSQGKNALDYLKQRGLSDKIIRHFGLGYAPEYRKTLTDKVASNPPLKKFLLETGMILKSEYYQSWYDRFHQRIMIPIRARTGHIVGFGGRSIADNQTPKYLNSPETILFHKGNLLYGLYEALKINKQPQQLVVVEGYMDVISLAQSGFQEAVATLGTAVTPYHIERLFRITKTIIFCFDGDDAGKKAAWHALETMLPIWRDSWEVKFLFLPDGEDPDSFIQKQGKPAFEKALKEATPFSQYFLNRLQKEMDFSQLEGHARFADQSLAYLKKMHSGLTKTLLVKAIAQITHISENRLQQQLVSSSSNSTQSTSYSQRKIKTLPSLVEQIISLLVQHPKLLQKHLKKIPKLPQANTELLHRLIQLLTTGPTFTTGEIIEYFRDEKEFDQLITGSKKQIIAPANGILDEFNGLINKLHKQYIGEKIDLLMIKAKQSNLNDAEKTELQKLLRAMQSDSLCAKILNEDQ